MCLSPPLRRPTNRSPLEQNTSEQLKCLDGDSRCSVRIRTPSMTLTVPLRISARLSSTRLFPISPARCRRAHWPLLAGRKRVHRRTLLLLTRSQGVQTDLPAPRDYCAPGISQIVRNNLSWHWIASHVRQQLARSRQGEQRHVASLPDDRATAGVMALLIDYLAKTSAKIQSTDIKILNQRLRKQHLLPTLACL